MIITKMHLPRRTVLRGIGISLALPFLDSMMPALKAAFELDLSHCRASLQESTRCPAPVALGASPDHV